jgi:hypothetical protein
MCFAGSSHARDANDELISFGNAGFSGFAHGLFLEAFYWIGVVPIMRPAIVAKKNEQIKYQIKNSTVQFQVYMQLD